MTKPTFSDEVEVVRGGGLTLMTGDVFVKAVVRHCAELEAENKHLRRIRDSMLVDTRVIKREVRAIRRAVSQT